MTKEELIGEVLLKLSGGSITTEFSVKYPEAEIYLAAAVNYVQTGNYWFETKQEGEHSINPLLMMTFDNIPVEWSEDHQRHFFTLPKRVITISKGRGLEVTTMSGKKCIPLGQGDDATEEYYGQYKRVVSYQIDSYPRVWVWNTGLLEKVRTRQLVHVGDLSATDEILLPSDGDVKVMDLMIGWLSGQKAAPTDPTLDGKDIK